MDRQVHGAPRRGARRPEARTGRNDDQHRDDRHRAGERTTQVYRVYIKATPERIWQAITDQEWNGRYGYAAPQYYELRPGGTYQAFATEEMKQGVRRDGLGIPDIIVDGEVVEVDPPRRLVQTWRMAMDPTAAPRASAG